MKRILASTFLILGSKWQRSRVTATWQMTPGHQTDWSFFLPSYSPRHGRDLCTGRQHQRVDWSWMEHDTAESWEPRGVEEVGYRLSSGAPTVSQTTGYVKVKMKLFWVAGCDMGLYLCLFLRCYSTCCCWDSCWWSLLCWWWCYWQ